MPQAQRIVASCRNGSRYRGPYISLTAITAPAVRLRAPARLTTATHLCVVLSYTSNLSESNGRLSVYSNGNERNRHRATYATSEAPRADRASARARLAEYHAPMSSDPAGYRALYFFLGGGAASTGAVGCTSGLIMYSTSPSKTPRSPSVFTSGSGVPNALV